MTFRLNLTELEDQIEYAREDIRNLSGSKDPGVRAEIRHLQDKVEQMQGVHARGIENGYGYHDYVPVKNTGRTLVLAIAFLLLALLVVGYLVTVL